MTATLKTMLPAILAWPPEDQEALAEAAREIEAARTGFYEMTPGELAEVDAGLAEVDRGEFASGDEMAALWKRHGAA